MQSSKTAEVVSEVRARSQALVAAEMAGEFETALTFFTPDVIVQAADVPQIQGRDPLLKMYETALANVAEFEGKATDIIVGGGGDMAYEYGVNIFHFEAPDGRVQVLGKYLVVWRKMEHEWYVSAIAFSNDAPQPN